MRTAFPPLNPPRAGATPEHLAAANQASIQAFHDAMRIAAGLLTIGAAVSCVGLRGTEQRPPPAAADHGVDA